MTELTLEILHKYDIVSIHPTANLLPYATEEEFKLLCDDIKTNGVQHSVIVDLNNVLLDGRNRLLAAHTVGVRPPVEEKDIVDPDSYIFSVNIARRHLTVGQRAALAAEFMTKRQQSSSADPHFDAREEAAKTFDIPPEQVSRANTVKQVSPVKFKQLSEGKVSLDKAYKQTKNYQQTKDNLRLIINRFKLVLEQDMFTELAVKLFTAMPDSKEELKQIIDECWK